MEINQWFLNQSFKLLEHPQTIASILHNWWWWHQVFSSLKKWNFQMIYWNSYTNNIFNLFMLFIVGFILKKEMIIKNVNSQDLFSISIEKLCFNIKEIQIYIFISVMWSFNSFSLSLIYLFIHLSFMIYLIY